ncbi:hypothetical protein [Aeoliella sp.]|uniref:hypothetical protein n=1 Tax=Aeoliella sp. TaxID=2795800 RepID=UPI003CCBDCD7
MKLLRASCDCGFCSRKARVGCHFHQWWFPLFERRTGQMHDIARALPDEQVVLIQLGKVAAAELHKPFLKSVVRELDEQYAGNDEYLLKPGPVDRLPCPQCSRSSLKIVQVRVVANCKADCGHEYRWLDSESRGCPRCNHRPHAFSADLEPAFADQGRVISSCPCSSNLESAAHTDAYCPKCGELPEKYRVDGREFCGMHHVALQPYDAPSNFLFIHTAASHAADQFPNAKHWGDATGEAHASMYCPNCESDHQTWLESHA